MNGSAIRIVASVVVGICFASAYVVSYEEDEVTVTVTNATAHYLHVRINDESFLYVAPGASAQTETALMSASCEAFYSPGQGASGRATKELTSTSTTTNTGTWSNTCSNNSSGCRVNDSDTYSSSYSRTPMSWTVTVADFPADTAAQRE